LLVIAGIGCFVAPAAAWAADAGAGTEPPAAEAPPPAQASPPAQAPPETQAPAAPGNAVVLGKDEIQGVVGKKVVSSTGEDMGAITNVIVDRDGRPRAAVIDFGGFLGVGTRKIAVDWHLLQFYAPDAKTPLKLDLSRADVQSAREYKPDDKSISVIAGPGHVAPVATPPTETAPAPSEGTPSEPAPPDATAPPLPPAPAADEP